MPGEKNSLLIDSQPAIDMALWEGYDKLPATEGTASDLLLPPQDILESEKSTFYDTGRQYLPDLRPSTTTLSQLDSVADSLLVYKRALEGIDANDDLKQLYRWRINERRAEMLMVEAAALGDVEGFATYNDFIYGAPSEAVFEATADQFCADAEQKLKSDNVQIAAAANRVMDYFGDRRGDRQLLAPDNDTFQAVRTDHFRQNGFYPLLLAGVEVPHEGKIDQEQGDPMIEKIIKNLGSDYAISDARAKAWGLDHANKSVRRPAGYSLPAARFLGLPVGHEVGSHLLERINGLRGPLRLLGDSLDRTEIGNEGRAVLREQIVYQGFDEFATKVRWQDILRRHAATSLAYGVGSEAMDFAEVYEVINAVDTLRQRSLQPDDKAGADRKAHARSWRLLESVFKGTPGYGQPYGRYAVYLEGNIACWQLASERPRAINEGDAGKFSIVNPRHIEVLGRYGVLGAGSESDDEK